MFVWILVVEVSAWSVEEILTELGVSNRNRVKREKVKKKRQKFTFRYSIY